MKFNKHTVLIKGDAVSESTELSETVIEGETDGHVEMNAVNIYPDVLFQKIDGFGGAMTESAAYSLSQLDSKKRAKAIDLYFSEKGSNYSLLRVPLDSCDFSIDMYQAVEHPENDPGFETFSLERVRKYIIPAIKDVISHSATPLDILLSPWSPPACWKTEPFYTVLGANAPEILKKTMPEEKPKKGTRCWGGHLKRENYPDWARYIVRYIKEYLKEGLPVKWISVQNESLANTPWDSCIWTADEEKTFLRDHLYPELLKNGLSDKIGIFIWDHNKERIYERAVSEIDDTTNNMVRGIAFHWYSGDHFEAVKLTRDRFPDKELMFTEGCVEYSVAGAQSKRQFAERYAHDIIGDINSGMNRWFDWNLYLDSKGGPNHVGNYCAAPIMLDGKGSFSIEPTYYYIKEFSSNIRRGARLTGFSRFTDKLEITSLKNPDGSICIIILNRSKDDININLRISGNLLKVQSFSHSIMDLVSV